MVKSIRIKSSFSYLHEVEGFLKGVLPEYKLGKTLSGYIRLVVCESVNNAINHGNKFDEHKFVTLFFDSCDKYISFEIHDEGDGFDFCSMPDPTLEANLRNEGGRGLFIIRNLADEFSFRNNGSVISIKFHINRVNTIS
ncbi:MAG: ATP-binding protein [Mangrovibacterium sp.]